MKRHSRFIALALCLTLLSGCGAEEPFSAAPDRTETPPTAAREEIRTLQVMCGEESGSACAGEDDNFNTPEVSRFVSPSISLTDASRAEFPQLAAALDRLTASEHTAALENFETMTADARDACEWSPESFAYICFFSESSYLVHRADERVLSISAFGSDYLGGAHPYSGWRALNYDSRTGEELTLDQVIPHQEGLLECIIDYTLQQTEGAYTREELEEVFACGSYPEYLTWTLDYDHVEFYFGDYELGSYAQGAWRIAIPFCALEGMIDPYYTAAPKAYAVPMDELYAHYIYADLAHDGVMRTVSASSWNSGEWGEENFISACADTISVSVDGEECSLSSQEIYGARSYFICAPDGEYYIYMVCADADYSSIRVFHLNAAADYCPEYVGRVSLGNSHRWVDEAYYDGAFDSGWDDALFMTLQITDPADMHLEAVTQTLGSFCGTKIFCVGEDGMPDARQDYYTFEDSDAQFLCVDIEADVVDPDTREVLGSDLLRADSVIYLDRTDAVSYADFRTEDGRIFRFRLEIRDGEEYINGVCIAEAFLWERWGAVG